jgi:cobyrinic acid a,c-diamide synthase
MTRSAAALVTGFQHFEAGIHIAGVIFNNVAGPRHEAKLRDAIVNYCGIPVVGSLPRDSMLNISERHLGLVPYPEINAKATLDRIRQVVEANLDLDLIRKIAGEAGATRPVKIPSVADKPAQVKIGVIFDQIFNFYYPENLEALKQAGAEIVLINSVKDRILPDIDALYIGGGFPELFLPELEANASLRQSINAAIENYLPVYAECAGLMYLCRSIKWRDNQYEMVGSIPASVELSPKPQAHGYVNIKVSRENPLFEIGTEFWGHEFHHSLLVKSSEINCVYQVLHGHGIEEKMDGISYKNVISSYVHLHASGMPSWANRFVNLAVNHHSKKTSLKTLTLNC